MLNLFGIALLTLPKGRTDTFAGHINFWSPESWTVFLNSICEDLEVETALDNQEHNFAIIKRMG
jgi:hypothetical protein